jgi:D-glycero-alpha-D-manno-heptose 1-phosphate guanylyltransferase
MQEPQNSELQSSPFRGRGGCAIILAGGLGTRLRSSVPHLPKCMAPVAGKPFLHYVIEHLKKQGVEKFIFSLGYMSEMIEAYLNDQHSMINVQYSIEAEPLGTGGAIKLACGKATEKTVLVVNGDTLFSIDLVKLSLFHNMCGADCTLSLKPMQNFDRYGAVEMNKDYSIASFKEKQHYDSGLINAGVYALNVSKFLKEDFPEIFSFEKGYLEKFTGQRRFYGVVQDEYFIDIGIPEDYARAQEELGGKPQAASPKGQA